MTVTKQFIQVIEGEVGLASDINTIGEENISMVEGYRTFFF